MDEEVGMGEEVRLGEEVGSSLRVSVTFGSTDFSTSPPYPLSTLGLLPIPITLLAFRSPRSFGLVTLVARPSVGDSGDEVVGFDDDAVPELEECGPKHFLIAFSPI